MDITVGHHITRIPITAKFEFIFTISTIAVDRKLLGRGEGYDQNTEQ